MWCWWCQICLPKNIVSDKHPEGGGILLSEKRNLYSSKILQSAMFGFDCPALQ